MIAPEPSQEPRKLEDSQLEAFDQEFISGSMWDRVVELIKSDFGDSGFTLLDIGGGNGIFVDALLDRFPNANATLLDNSNLLLSKNKPHPRKLLICESATNLESALGRQHFDVIFMNWILHHLVLGSYRQTLELQRTMLTQVTRHLTERGRIHVAECIYEGALFPNLPGWMIFQATSSRLLAPLVRKFGANTAGCGVCFHNHSHWRRAFESAALKPLHLEQHPDWNPSWIRKLALQLRTVHHSQYWLSRS